ncbi:hypothetical protein AJ80_03855 [Polytolypa hystricis UAMH7299]|uniref:AB hydrolase-1 domain-containing protein n=1 Tax=Polytolypa hystricis (strain UAMH7299) TaxID=1447883 RepID=A0A2B7YES5_POLH7|nr:hypothetical protein AJ80_03855 [Polytolypa hystricis UAMH7299]
MFSTLRIWFHVLLLITVAVTAHPVKKPTIVFVPGAWHTPAGYDKLLPLLHAAGYATTAVDLPSVGASPGVPDFSADVTAIRNTVSGLVELLGRDVVVVSHSYGGVPATEALRGLSKQDQRAQGGKGGVVGLAYVAAILPQVGGSLATALENKNDAEAAVAPTLETIDNGDGTETVVNPEETFYGDVDPTEAAYCHRILRTQSTGPYLSPLTYDAYRHIPSGYLLCKQDKAIPYIKGQRLAREAGITFTETINSSHSPFLSHPEAVVRFIRRVAGERKKV